MALFGQKPATQIPNCGWGAAGFAFRFLNRKFRHTHSAFGVTGAFPSPRFIPQSFKKLLEFFT
jgi:hypothetical protein